MRKVLPFLLVMVLLLSAAIPALAQARPTVTDLLSSGDVGSFTMLLSAINLVGLDDVVNGDGPYTFLAPTDDAITAALSSMGMSAADFMANPDMLREILQYHVIPGRYFFRQLTSGPTLPTALEGESVTFNLADGAFTVNGVNISNPDNVVTNGVVHVIDGVLLPPSMTAPAPASTPEATPEPAPTETAAPTEAAVVAPPARPSIGDLLSSGSLGSFSTLLAAIDATGLSNTLAGDGPFTVFAPTDDAFTALLDQVDLTADDLLAQPDLLHDILLYHVVPGRYFFRNLTTNPTLTTALSGQTVDVFHQGNTLTVNDANITDVDNLASNGVVFVIDKVLLTADQLATLTPSGAHLRVAHFSPDAGAVDVYVNGKLKLQNVSFGTVGDWMDIRPGDYSFAVVPTGTEPSGSDLSTHINTNDWITVAATGTVAQGSVRLTVLYEDYGTIAENRVRLSVFHGIENGGAVDVYVNGELLIGALRYPGTLNGNDGFDIREVGAGLYQIQVKLAGTDTVILDRPGLALEPGNNYLLALVGTPGQARLVTAATAVQ